MNYELAKQLKDAGFPQLVNPRVHLNLYQWPPELPTTERTADNADTKIPTLSELIEACGDGFAYIAKDISMGWRARADGGDSGSFAPCYGSTPEEAVAKLWLALNECNHVWVDARNEVVESGEVCFKCGKIR